MRISDWSSDVCSSDLAARAQELAGALPPAAGLFFKSDRTEQVFAAPVLSSDVVIEIAGDIARVAVRQHFRNPSQAWPERSDERRVGKECVSTCRSRWSPYN